MKYLGQTMMAVLLLGALAAHGAERTGREFNELVQEINQRLDDAKAKVERIDADYKEKHAGAAQRVLPERQAALDELTKRQQAFDAARTPAAKQAAEAQLRDQVLTVAEKSADYLEAYKGELDNQDAQLAVVEETLADVIMKLDRLSRMAAAGEQAETEEERDRQRLQARQELQGLAQMVQMLSESNPQAQHWRSVKQTILLQDAVLKRHLAGSDRIQEMLTRQMRAYEQTHAQVTLARQAMAEERGIVAQIALGQVAESMLRKAAAVLLGNANLGDLGIGAMEQLNARQDGLRQFMEQGEGVDVVSGDQALPGGGDEPDGWGQFLGQKIQ